MLELRPNCEWCDKDLPPDAKDANICSYECTFCDKCVEEILEHICPNCGGDFVRRPIRPAVENRQGVSLIQQPASKQAVHSPYALDELKSFIQVMKSRKSG